MLLWAPKEKTFPRGSGPQTSLATGVCTYRYIFFKLHHWLLHIFHFHQHLRFSRTFHSIFRVQTDDISINREIPVDAYIGYLSTWSGWQTYLKKHPGSDALQDLQEK